MQRAPMYQLSGTYLLRAVAASAGAGAVGGFVWAFLFSFNLGIIFAILVGAGLGYLISSAMNWATNRKRGPSLQIIGGAGAILAYVVRGVLENSAKGSFDLGSDLGGLVLVAVAIAVIVNQLR
jgi:hypothetical protein